MKLSLADPRAITSKAAEITRIGDQVRDPTLYHRIEQACLDRRAFLFTSGDGFVVLNPVAGPGVLVWAAHSHKPVDRLAYQSEIEHLAHDIGARFIRFLSNRTGFKRVGWNLGYTSAPGRWCGQPITIWTKQL